MPYRKQEADIENENLIHEFFDVLDENKDGVLTFDEVKGALDRWQLPSSQEHINNIFASANASKDKITYPDFKRYMAKQIEALRDSFDSIDKDRSGTLEPAEVQESIEQMYHITLPLESVNALMSKIGATPGHITFVEFQWFLMMLPIHTHEDDERLQHIFDYWKDVASVDFGEGPMNMMDGHRFAFTRTLVAIQQSYPSLAAGAAAGVVSRTCTAPVDRLKTIMQLQTRAPDGKYGSIFNGLRSIWYDGGVRGFFQGNGLNCTKILPESAAKFFLYENLKHMLAANSGSSIHELTIGQRFVAGSIAGAFSQLLVYPMDCLKTRMAASPRPVAFPEMVSLTYRMGGVPSFYRGLSPSLLGMIPYAGIDLALYETLKNFYTDYHLKKSISNLRARSESVTMQPAHGTIIAPLVCGTISSAVAQLVAYPLSLVRTRMQAQGTITALGRSARTYNGMWDVLVTTVKNEGIRGLYKGIGPNYLKVIPSVSISYVVYENTKRYLLCR